MNEAFTPSPTPPNIAPRRRAPDQYDTMARTNTVVHPGGDAAETRSTATRKALAAKVDGNGRYVYLNPRTGGRIAVAEAARNVVATGAEPLAITNCLNFGNPYKPDMYYLFREAVGGMGDACRVFNTPVTGGNVSLYNESPDSAVYPTPTIGMVGLIEDIDYITPAYFRQEGDVIYLLGETKPEIGGSEFLKSYYGQITGDSPSLDLELEHKTQQAMLKAIRSGVVQSCHDLADGGLAVALSESCISNRQHQLGASVQLGISGMRPECFLFSESQSRFLFSVAPENAEKVESLFDGLSLQKIGGVGGAKLSIDNLLNVAIADISAAYFNRIHEIMD